MRFSGVASSVRVDRQGERMTARALAKMAQVQRLQLLPQHGSAEAIGVVEKCWVEEGTLRVAGQLRGGDRRARQLYMRLRAGERRGLSVGGRVKGVRVEVDAVTRRRVRCIDDVELDHVAVCDVVSAQNADTYVTVG